MDLNDILTRRAGIESARRALDEEDERLVRALRQWGTQRARAAVREAGFVRGESVVVERRIIRGVEHTYRMGILLDVEVDWGPGSPDDCWTLCVRTRSVLRSGKPGQALDRRSFRVPDPADLPSRLKVVGSVDREAALSHPRIVRTSIVRKGQSAPAA